MLDVEGEPESLTQQKFTSKDKFSRRVREVLRKPGTMGLGQKELPEDHTNARPSSMNV